jgi:RHS repeat-associated protein
LDYFPYGKILREFIKTPEKYVTTGHERDVETGLDYRGARFYDSDVARFLSLDPLAAEFLEWSDYNYVLGNPVMFIDPDGKSPEPPKVISYSESVKMTYYFDRESETTTIRHTKSYTLVAQRGTIKTRETISKTTTISIDRTGEIINQSSKKSYYYGSRYDRAGRLMSPVKSTDKTLPIVPKPLEELKNVVQNKIDEEGHGAHLGEYLPGLIIGGSSAGFAALEYIKTAPKWTKLIGASGRGISIGVFLGEFANYVRKDPVKGEWTAQRTWEDGDEEKKPIDVADFDKAVDAIEK